MDLRRLLVTAWNASDVWALALNRGNLFALKRLFVAALGALGLGALAAGPVVAQADQIPAPRLYGDITNCMTDAPTSVTRAMGMTSSVLDRLFELELAAITSTTTVGPPNNSIDVRNALLARIDNPCSATGSSSNDIAEGFAEARRLYNNAEGLRAAASGENPTQRAIDDFNEALAKKASYGGAVFDAVFEEEGAWRATDKALTEWNSLFTGDDPVYTNAKAGYDAVNISKTALDPQVSGVDDPDNPYGRDSILGFQSIGTSELSATSSASDITTAVGTDNVINPDSGNLEFTLSISNQQRQNDADDSVESQSAITTLGQITTHLSAWQTAVTDAQDVYDDADPNTVDRAPLLVTLNRLKAGRDHVQSELERLTRVARAVNPQVDHDGDGGTTPTVSAVSLLNGFESALGQVRSAESMIRGAAAGLESARNNVKAQLENADSYLSQLVQLREYEKQQLLDLFDNEPPESQLEAVNEAVAAAKEQLATHSALAGADTNNPAAALLTELLKPRTNADDEVIDDDGLALVNAISATYETAAGAADAAREVVDELTGEGGQVAMNTASIASNASKIEDNLESIVALEGEVWDADGNSRIDANETRSMENRGMIMTNSENIMTNAENIMTNATEIGRVEGRVDTNWDAIAVNQTAIAGNVTAIEANSGRISSNADAIAANMNSIGSNASAIGDNRNMIGELSDDLDVVRAGVAASMALAGMPAINGRGVSLGIGSFDGESAFAVGFQIQGEMASFKVGVTSASGATGASAGVGFQF